MPVHVKQYSCSTPGSQKVSRAGGGGDIVGAAVEEATAGGGG
jgi:hypothetical protein